MEEAHWNLTLPVDLLHLNVKSRDKEVSILRIFLVSEHVHSPWVISKSLHDLAPTYLFSFNPFLPPDPMVQPYWATQSSWLWWVFIDLYVVAYAVLSATNPLFAIIFWDISYIILSDLIKESGPHVSLLEVPLSRGSSASFSGSSHIHCLPW